MKPNLKPGDIIQYSTGHICTARVIKVEELSFTYSVFLLNGKPYGPTEHTTPFENWDAYNFQILPPTPERTEAIQAMKRWKETFE